MCSSARPKALPKPGVSCRWDLLRQAPTFILAKVRRTAACFFRNAMVELLWVSDSREAMNEASRNARLWERWSKRASSASPFGICTRPLTRGMKGPPFAAWEYKPAYLPPELCMYIGKAPIDEPMWVHLDFIDREYRVKSFVEHPNGATEISGLRLTTPIVLRSDPARVLLENHVVILGEGRDSLLEIEVDHQRRNKTLDLRPALPVVFRL
jgi:hypothetical protein